MIDDRDARSIVLTIDSIFENVSLIGVAVRGICSHLSFSETDIYHIELCVVESVNNAIKHAYGLEPGHTVEVKISVLNDSVVFEVHDTGKQMDKKHMDVENKKHICNFDSNMPVELPENGFGLFFIHSLMDEIDYCRVNEKNILTLKKYMKKL